jgi:hypothetical protein
VPATRLPDTPVVIALVRWPLRRGYGSGGKRTPSNAGELMAKQPSGTALSAEVLMLGLYVAGVTGIALAAVSGRRWALAEVR